MSPSRRQVVQLPVERFLKLNQAAEMAGELELEPGSPLAGIRLGNETAVLEAEMPKKICQGENREGGSQLTYQLTYG